MRASRKRGIAAAFSGSPSRSCSAASPRSSSSCLTPQRPRSKYLPGNWPGARCPESGAMTTLLILCVVLLSFANGANDNFKGVATLWGSGLTTYQRAIAWATGFTVLGSLAAIWLGSALAAKFSGAKYVDAGIAAQLPFLIAVALGAGCTVLLAARLGLPISTTHSITGALVGAGVMAAGFSHVKFSALGKGVVLPLLFSPIVALVLTVCVQLLLRRFDWAK